MTGETPSVTPIDSKAARSQARRERVVLVTSAYRIEGTIELPPESYRSRLSDYLNRDVLFIPLTDALKVPVDGGPASHHRFLAVAKSALITVYPYDDERI